MTTSKHTPGPWRSTAKPLGLDGRGHLIHGPHQAPLCQVIEAPGNGAKVAEAKANAQLIASAPELLEACRQIVWKLSHNHDLPATAPAGPYKGPSLITRNDATVKMAVAAIAKATGDDVAEAAEVAEELGVEDMYFPPHDAPPNGATADTPAYKGGAK